MSFALHRNPWFSQCALLLLFRFRRQLTYLPSAIHMQLCCLGCSFRVAPDFSTSLQDTAFRVACALRQLLHRLFQKPLQELILKLTGIRLTTACALRVPCSIILKHPYYVLCSIYFNELECCHLKQTVVWW